MKRKIILLFASILLIGCGGNNSNMSHNDSSIISSSSILSYEEFLNLHPSYQGSEEEYYRDSNNGLFDDKEISILSVNEDEYELDGYIVDGYVDHVSSSLNFDNAIIDLEDKSFLLGLNEDESFSLILEGKLSSNNQGSQILVSDAYIDNGRIYIGTNIANNALYLGLNIGETYYNYCFRVKGSTFLEDHRYEIKFDGKEFNLYVDDNEPLYLNFFNVNQANHQAVTSSSNLSKEFISKVHAIIGQNYFKMNYLGADTHKLNASLKNMKIKISGSYYYQTLEDHPLMDTSIAYLGSSITRGHGGNTDGISFADQIGQLTNNYYNKEAVSGTTLASSKPNSYVKRMDNLDLSDNYDALVVQLSTNDFSQNVTRGEISSSTSSSEINSTTITGGIEYIIAKAKELAPNIKIYFYACPLKTNYGSYFSYKEYLEGTMLEIADKWNITIIDFFHEMEYVMNNSYIQGDGLHPTKEGYGGLMSPYMINLFLKDLI